MLMRVLTLGNVASLDVIRKGCSCGAPSNVQAPLHNQSADTVTVVVATANQAQDGRKHTLEIALATRTVCPPRLSSACSSSTI